MMDLVLEQLPLVMLGAVLGLDVVSFPQAMISRPLVAATLGGTLVGNPMAGLLLGAVLELFALETLPFGASRYPEWGSAAAVAGGLYAAEGEWRAGAIALSVLLVLMLAQLGGRSMIWLRQLNGRWAQARVAQLEAGDGRTIAGLQVGGLVADVVRGALVASVGVLAGRLLMPPILDAWRDSELVSRGGTVAVAVAVAAAAGWKLFHIVRGGRLIFTAGLAAGLLIFLVLR